jgi:branched-chain amino acid transport system ATP-binding protein
MPMLRVENVTVHYGKKPALQGITITAEKGEFVGVLGSNRAGKSTLLQTISGLIPLSEGEITFDGRPISKMAPHRIPSLGVAHVPEGRQLFPKLNVEENLKLGAILPEARGRSKESLEMVYSLFPRLEQRRHQMAGSLSGGEQQMVAIGRGLMLQPRLLMLDEPSLGLAPILVDEVYEKIREIRRLGMAVLLVEQNIPLSLSCIERGYLLENGRVVFEGTAKELEGNEMIKEAYLGL